jgi:hypothetical protein
MRAAFSFRVGAPIIGGMKMAASSTSMADDSGSAAPAVKMAAAQRRGYRVWAAALVGLGLLLLAYNISGPWPGAGAAAALWPALVILLGVGLPFVAWWARGFQLPAFACDRNSCEAAELWVTAGTADVRVEAFVGASQLAVGKFPSLAGPQVMKAGAVTRLVMDHRAAAPLLSGGWSAALNKTLPWSLQLRASVGGFVLDLRDLLVVKLDLESVAGPVDLTLPAAGQGEMALRLLLGDLTLRVPEGVGVKLKFEAGPLATLKLNGRRLVRLAADEWATPDFSTAPQRFALRVNMLAGDLKLV